MLYEQEHVFLYLCPKVYFWRGRIGGSLNKHAYRLDLATATVDGKRQSLESGKSIRVRPFIQNFKFKGTLIRYHGRFD